MTCVSSSDVRKSDPDTDFIGEVVTGGDADPSPRPGTVPAPRSSDEAADT